MSPTGPSRLGSSIAVLPAPVQSEPVKGTFLLCSKVTFSYCCDILVGYVSSATRSLQLKCAGTTASRSSYACKRRSLSVRGIRPAVLLGPLREFLATQRLYCITEVQT